jgi:hypothetical protein
MLKPISLIFFFRYSVLIWVDLKLIEDLNFFRYVFSPTTGSPDTCRYDNYRTRQNFATRRLSLLHIIQVK